MAFVLHSLNMVRIRDGGPFLLRGPVLRESPPYYFSSHTLWFSPRSSSGAFLYLPYF